MTRTRTRILGPGDEERLEAFLVRHADVATFQRSNWRRAGLVDQGQPFQGTYAAALDGDGDDIVAAAAHFWNGMVNVVAPVAAVETAQAATAASGRKVSGFVGPWAQICAARAALGLAGAAANMDSRDLLFALDLADLILPAPLADGTLVARHPTAEEVPLITAWRSAYHVELLGSPAGPETDARAHDEIQRSFGTGDQWVVSAPGGPPLAYSGFNARLPDMVQIGGVYTPPETRRRGLARCAVAGSLVVARAQGVRRSVLFTGEDNPAACRTYEAIGYRVVGDFGLILLA